MTSHRIFGLTPQGTIWRATWTIYPDVAGEPARPSEWVVDLYNGTVGALRLGLDANETLLREEAAMLIAASGPAAE
jgi:hypothetical protein